MRPLFGVLAALVLLCGSLAYSQEPKSPAAPGVQVDTHEIVRMGDRVAITGDGHRDDGESLFSAAMAPPADDTDQWYITLWGSSKDPATETLRKAFERDPHLAAYVAAPPGEGKRPWAHFNVYYADDPMQRFRFQKASIPLTGPFPVITLNTPRDGSFGGTIEAAGPDGKKQQQAVIVDRIEGTTDPAAVGRRIGGSVKLWIKKLQASGFVFPAKIAERIGPPRDQVAEVTDTLSVSHGQPWPNTPPQQQPFNPVFPQGGPAADPTPAPGADFSQLIKLIGMFFPSIQTIMILALTLSNVWMAYRDTARVTGIPLAIDDATAKMITDLIKNLNGKPAS
jgi:hypothetical protein